MEMYVAQAGHHDVRAFIEEAMRTGVMLADVLGSILENLPEDAFPGEDPVEVLLEMVVGSVRPAADAAGGQTVRAATALLGAVSDRTLNDLRAAAALARRR